jgi:hypothetical protein
MPEAADLDELNRLLDATLAEIDARLAAIAGVVEATERASVAG